MNFILNFHPQVPFEILDSSTSNIGLKKIKEITISGHFRCFISLDPHNNFLSYFFLLAYLSNWWLHLPMHLPPEPPCLSFLWGLLTWPGSPLLSLGYSPFPHSRASREAHISPPPPSPNTSCSSAFLLPTNIFCCYGNGEAVLEGGGVLEHNHCWPRCGSLW